MIRLSRLVLAALAVAVAATAAAQETDPAPEPSVPYLVRDLDEGRNAFPVPGCNVLCPQIDGSYPTELTPAGERLFFVASDGVSGRQVWVTEGTAETTHAVDALTCEAPSILDTFGEGVVVRCAAAGGSGPPLWITDGSPEGTYQLVALPGCGVLPCSFVADWPAPAEVDGSLFLAVPGPAEGLFDVWRTDGTAAGTSQVDLGDLGVRSLLAHDGRLYLVGQPAAGGHATAPERLLRLEEDDGLSELARACTFASQIEGVTALGGDLYLYSGCLAGAPGGPGTSLFRIDLAGPGVAEIADRVRPWPLAEDPRPLFSPLETSIAAPPAIAGEAIYFVRRPNSDDELWRLQDGALDLVAPLPFGVGRLLVAGERPIVVGEDPVTYGLSESGLSPIGPGVPFWRFDFFTDAPADAPGGDLFFASHLGALWRTDGTSAGTEEVVPPFAPGRLIGFTGVARAGDRVYFAHDDGEHGVELWALAVEEASAFGCVEDGATLCLAGGRFAVDVSWRDPRSGDVGVGHAVRETADSGFFWFFHPDNLEVLAKVLDAETVNGHHWVFHGSLTDVEYELRVEDLATGDVRTYERPAGSLCGGADAAAFPTAVGTAAGGAAASGPATPVSASLLLGAGDRFTVAVDWLDPATGSYVPATTVEKTADSGWAWFFDPANVEVFVKVLDATALDGHHWVFHGGLTDLGYRVTVIDGLSGAQRVYEKAPGSLCGGADTAAF